MVWLPRNEKQTYRLNSRPQMWPWPWKVRCEDRRLVEFFFFFCIFGNRFAVSNYFCSIYIILSGLIVISLQYWHFILSKYCTIFRPFCNCYSLNIIPRNILPKYQARKPSQPVIETMVLPLVLILEDTFLFRGNHIRFEMLSVINPPSLAQLFHCS